MTLAEEHGVKICFEHRCSHVDVANNGLHFELADKTAKTVQADLLFGADGAFSALHEAYTHMSRVNCDQQYLDYPYKELAILPGKNGEWLMEQNALHIWPRGNFMLIALPNTDKTFTCTLFLPWEGEVSFEKLKTEADVNKFFDTYFPDAKELMPELMKDFFGNPTAPLVTRHISQWHYLDKSALIGDAAHAIVPFYGQGMNAGFEDCTVLARLMDEKGENWAGILKEYEFLRKPNGNAVAALALLNFVEMRDKVKDPRFLMRKKIEKELGKLFPDKFVSVYEMVSFSHIPYHTAISCIEAQDALLERVMEEGDFFTRIADADFGVALENMVSDYHQSVQQLDFGNED
jgi:kynurenine 3-monooxygenase